MSTQVTKPCERCGTPFAKRHHVSWNQWKTKRFCSRECWWNTPRDRTPISERLWSRVEKEGHCGCWIWTGATTRGGLYGVIGKPGRRGGNIVTHVAAYTEHKGPIPNGYQVDHLCRVTLCCNPDHLEAVTQAENLRRQFEAARADRAKAIR